MVTLRRHDKFAPAPDQGFTLVEMLIVMLIIGLMAGTLMTTLSLPGSNQLRREAENLAWLLQENALQARATGIAITWQPLADGYQFTPSPQAMLVRTDPTTKPPEPKIHKFAADIRISAVHTLENEPLSHLALTGRSIARPSTIRLANHNEEIEVFSEGLNLFKISPTRALGSNEKR